MTIPISSAPAARRFLFTQFTAALTPDPLSPRSSLLVCYDEPNTSEPDDIVAVAKVNRQIAPISFVGSGGAGWLNETYTIEVEVDVFRGGDDAQAAYERCALLCDAVIAVVRTDPTLGGAVITARPMQHMTGVSWDAQHLGRHATATIEIECVNRI